MKDLNSELFKADFSDRQKREARVVPVHLPSLASVCGDSGSHKGFAKDGWMICLAGLPGHGKSVSAVNFACAALDAGEPVAYVSLEMSAEQLAARYYAMKTGIDVSLLEQGNFNERAFDIVKEKTANLPPIYVPNEVTSDWQHCADFIKECVEDYNCEFVILDYLQICNSGDEQNIYKAMAELMTDLRAYAQQQKIAILVLSQFNRETASQYKLRPRMSGLWGGSIIEQVCDLILLLGHHAYERDNENRCARTWLLVEI